MMSKKYGLDKPLIVQFFTYVKNLLQGDFGVSYVISKDTSISVLLKNRVPVSFGIGLDGSFLRCGSRTDFRYSGSAQEK